MHARKILSGLDFDMIILDVMMPGEDGVSLTKYIRETRQTPILLLTAKGDIEDRIVGLEAGADDYLSKPFEPKELLLRINAILRRVPQPKITQVTPTILHLGICRYDIARGELWQGDQLVRLTGTEHQLMKIFASSVSAPVSRAQLVSELGRDESQAQDRAIDVQITRLRRKLEANPKEPRYLQTVRGAGYMLVND
jgi:two-component system phosphate regulon response regulator OmpR